MSTNEISTYLKYANLQMAAEAFLVDPDTGAKRFSGDDLIKALQAGNNHASKFTEIAAKQFADPDEGWTVIDQKPNTGTGFSGTLFKNNKTGELVISFRSTEFIDDSVHDNQATNVMEVKAYGWAFGQIDDMEKWYAELKANGSIQATDKFSVTGYSLGANLATAFNLLRKEDAERAANPIANPITATYTFNGAGVGDLLNGARLTDVIANFDRMRQNVSGSEITFTDPLAIQIYQALRQKKYQSAAAVYVDASNVAEQTFNASEKALLLDALSRIKSILEEAARVPVLSSGGDNPTQPVAVLPAQIDAARLDYQLAVLTVGKSTAAHAAGVIAGGALAVLGRDTKAGLSNIVDIYGAAPPSAVANSQWHYGTPVPIYIEDQPLYRGSAAWNAVVESALYFDVKLLGPGYAVNDFGDTHSLVLIVDSLAVGDILGRLDPTLKAKDMAAIFSAATASKQQTLGSSQGKAEGDTLETVVDSLSRMLRNVDPALRSNSRLNEGGTWADLEPSKDLRTPFYRRFKTFRKAMPSKIFSAKSPSACPTPAPCPPTPAATSPAC